MTIHSVQHESEAALVETLSFKDATRARRSIRGFLDTPVPDNVIRDVLEDAQFAPSNCNTQPWNTHVVSGKKLLKQLSEILHTKNDEGEFTPDFSFDQNDFHGEYRKRNDALGKAYYDAMNVMREDKEGRRRVGALNYSFFNAPHVAFLFMLSFGDNVRVAGDMGMYGQTLLLSLAARGLGGIPQTALGFFAEPIREFLGISDELKLLFGISFGYPDEAAPGNRIFMDRVPVDTSVTFHN